MNNEEKKEITVSYKIDDQEIKLTPTIVQQYIVGTDAKITMSEFKMFTELCKVRKLNPFLKEAYLIKYKAGQAASIVVGKDAILKRAVLNPKYNGIKSGIIVTRDGVEIERRGTFKLPNENLVGGWAEVYRKDWEYPIYCSVSYEEAVQKKTDGTPNSNWQKQPATMIEKVAKVRALREAFVEDLGGMYDADEINTNEFSKVEPVEESIIQEEPQQDIKEADYEEVNMNEL